MDNKILQLAMDLDSFEYDYDYYSYMDAFDSREESVERFTEGLITGTFIDEIIEHLSEIVNEHEAEWEFRAQALMNRVKEISR